MEKLNSEITELKNNNDREQSHIRIAAENEDLNQHVEKLEGEEDILRCRIKQILSVVADEVWKK